jgi:signal transduction histidine kinase
LPEVWQRHPDEAMRGLDDLRQLTKGALAEMRTLLWEMRPEALLERDLGSLLHQLADASASRSRVPVDVVIEGERRFSEDVQVELYRITQESLHNIAKHAQATQVSVQLHCIGDEVELKIGGNGQGFDDDEPSVGLGLGIMRERERTIDGELTIESKRRERTTVTVRLNKTTKEQQ